METENERLGLSSAAITITGLLNWRVVVQYIYTFSRVFFAGLYVNCTIYNDDDDYAIDVLFLGCTATVIAKW